jgi:hypothetical protein
VGRLLEQGFALYPTGLLNVRVANPVQLYRLGESALTDPHAHELEQLISSYRRLFNSTTPAIPRTADIAPIQDLLLRIRRHNL